MGLEQFEAFIFDIDGTLLKGEETVKGAEDLVLQLEEHGKKYSFYTDNTLLSSEGWSSRLKDMGVPPGEAEVVNPVGAAEEWVEETGADSAYILGSSDLHSELDLRSSKEAEAVLAGFDRRFSYRKMATAAEILEDGSLGLMSRQRWHLKSEGRKPHQRPINDALSNFAEPELLGKPSDRFVDQVKRRLSYRPSSTILVGDGPDDIRLGKKLGVSTGLVMSGETSRSELRHLDDMETPDFVISNLTRITRKVR